jgi:integrase
VTTTLYAAYVLILVRGLRKGEVLGLTWDDVDLDEAELTIGQQLQRVGCKLLHRKPRLGHPTRRFRCHRCAWQRCSSAG